VNKQVQGLVMLLLGGAVVKAGVTDMMLRYVKPGLRPFLILAGVLLIMAAVMTLFYDLRDSRRAAAGAHDEHDHEHDDGHGHGNHDPQVGWLLVLPVLGVLLVAPPALGSFTAGNSGSVLAGQSSDSDYAPLPKGNPDPLSLLDYASRAVFDQGKTLTGHNLKLVGFVTPGKGGGPMLTRIVMTCCAADARPIKVGLAGNIPSSIRANTWVKVVGTYVPTTAKDPVNGAVVPYLQVTSWQETAEPDQPYEASLPYQ
jgi:uncharacterized repeat protein (TIGR03943 family)